MTSPFAFFSTGTPPLTRFFGPGKNLVKGRFIVLNPQNGEFESQKSTFYKSKTAVTIIAFIFFIK